jgi:DNA-directed RNA polymerase specialized sigma24 family protein
MLTENNKRLDVLYRKHNEWLRKVAWNICKDVDMVDELVAELYLYLGEKGNENIYFLDSFNLQYCNSFLKSRFINKIKLSNRYTEYEPDENELDEAYNYDYDTSIDNTYSDIKTFLKTKQTSGDWVSAKIAELYYFGKGFTIEGLAAEVGVSKSTVFLHIKAMKKEIRENINNPFRNNGEE